MVNLNELLPSIGITNKEQIKIFINGDGALPAIKNIQTDCNLDDKSLKELFLAIQETKFELNALERFQIKNGKAQTPSAWLELFRNSMEMIIRSKKDAKGAVDLYIKEEKIFCGKMIELDKKNKKAE